MSDELPRSANGIDAELVGVTGPAWSGIEGTARRWNGRSTELMIDGSHGVLWHTPRIILLGNTCRWNNQGCWLSVGQVIVLAMPGLSGGRLLCPSVTACGGAESQNA